MIEACEGVRVMPNEGPMESDVRDVGNTSLRRKLFGQPDRQVCTYMCIRACTIPEVQYTV